MWQENNKMPVSPLLFNHPCGKKEKNGEMKLHIISIPAPFSGRYDIPTAVLLKAGTTRYGGYTANTRAFLKVLASGTIRVHSKTLPALYTVVTLYTLPSNRFGPE